MPSESTPLLQTVPVAEHRERYPHRSLRRYCTIALASIPILTLIIILVCIAVGADPTATGKDGTVLSVSKTPSLPHESWPWSEGLSYNELKKIMHDTPDAEKAREWSQYYASGPHLTGKNLSQAEWTRDKWVEFGISQSEIVSYDVYLNYPVDHGLALLKDGKVEYEATLEEDVIPEDSTSGLEDRIPTFHGYSASGDVTASYVFCNYGTYSDFEDLQKAGVDLAGKIALVKYGGIFRGLKVKRAAELGMVGAVIYSDPGDDGEMTEENGYDVYPDGPARHPSSVQRGSVAYISVAPGDPTTIGYPSKPGAPRQSVEGKIPGIPSLPISYAEALPLLKALNGHGPNASSFPSSWQSGGLAYKGVEYSIGPTPESTMLHLMNKQEYVITPAWNVIGIINGSIPDEVLVIGNHRDAWIAGGAADPNSGSAVLNEVIRSFGEALAKGWKPQRTIVFASWDGEEYGLIGSTEWVEEYLPWLDRATVAYINVDVGASGPHFRTAAAPVLNKAIYEITGQVQSPNQTIKGQSVRDTWNGYIATMGSGSDFTAFQDYAGISSIDLGFTSGPTDPVYHYHSNYDSSYWMDKFGDPGFKYHATMAKIIGLLAAKLVEEPVVSFNATDYAIGLDRYLQSVKALVTTGMSASNIFAPLDEAIEEFQRASTAFDFQAARLIDVIGDERPILAHLRREIYKSARAVNTKYKSLERQFLYAPGLDSRTWFKHVVFAPGLWTGYAGATYPGLVEALDAKNETAALKWVGIVRDAVERATDLLIPQ